MSNPVRVPSRALALSAILLCAVPSRAGNLEPPGPPAPTMKTLQQVEPRIPISSLPFTISQSGSYYLTGNLTGVSGQIGIRITAPTASLDLAGFTLQGVPGSFDGINLQTDDLSSPVFDIRNGTITGW